MTATNTVYACDAETMASLRSLVSRLWGGSDRDRDLAGYLTARLDAFQPLSVGDYAGETCGAEAPKTKAVREIAIKAGAPVAGLPTHHEITGEREQARRAADSVAMPWTPPVKHMKLVRSLYPYVSVEDWTLTRTQFLATVISRIQDDLEYGTY